MTIQLAADSSGDTVVAANNFLLPNATFIVEFILFLVILGIVARFVLPPLQTSLRERREMVRKQIEDSEQARQQLVDAQQAYQDALHDARTEAAQIRENARAEAQRTVDDLRTRAQEESARIVSRGEEQLNGQRAEIVRDLRTEVGTMAVELSEKIVAQPLAQEPDVTTTVNSFLAGVAADEKARNEVQA